MISKAKSFTVFRWFWAEKDKTQEDSEKKLDAMSLLPRLTVEIRRNGK